MPALDPEIAKHRNYLMETAPFLFDSAVELFSNFRIKYVQQEAIAYIIYKHANLFEISHEENYGVLSGLLINNDINTAELALANAKAARYLLRCPTFVKTTASKQLVAILCKHSADRNIKYFFRVASDSRQTNIVERAISDSEFSLELFRNNKARGLLPSAHIVDILKGTLDKDAQHYNRLVAVLKRRNVTLLGLALNCSRSACQLINMGKQYNRFSAKDCLDILDEYSITPFVLNFIVPALEANGFSLYNIAISDLDHARKIFSSPTLFRFLNLREILLTIAYYDLKSIATDSLVQQLTAKGFSIYNLLQASQSKLDLEIVKGCSALWQQLTVAEQENLDPSHAVIFGRHKALLTRAQSFYAPPPAVYKRKQPSCSLEAHMEGRTEATEPDAKKIRLQRNRTQPTC